MRGDERTGEDRRKKREKRKRIGGGGSNIMRGNGDAE